MNDKQETNQELSNEQLETLRRLYRYIMGPTWGKSKAAVAQSLPNKREQNEVRKMPN